MISLWDSGGSWQVLTNQCSSGSSQKHGERLSVSLDAILGNCQVTQEEEAVSCSHCIQQEVVRQRKEYFEDLLNTIEKLSVVEAESGNEGEDLPMTGDEVTDHLSVLLWVFQGVWQFAWQWGNMSLISMASIFFTLFTSSQLVRLPLGSTVLFLILLEKNVYWYQNQLLCLTRIMS